MRQSDPPIFYLVGTPKGRLSRLEQDLVARPWHEARDGVQVKLLPQDGEVYVFAESRDRVAKERAMRRRQLKWLWARLKQLATMKIGREELLMKLGAARAKAPTAWRLVEVKVAARDAAFTYRLDRDKLRQARRREGRYLLRTNRRFPRSTTCTSGGRGVPWWRAAPRSSPRCCRPTPTATSSCTGWGSMEIRLLRNAE